MSKCKLGFFKMILNTEFENNSDKNSTNTLKSTLTKCAYSLNRDLENYFEFDLFFWKKVNFRKISEFHCIYRKIFNMLLN
jgi:hypothetical protein